MLRMMLVLSCLLPVELAWLVLQYLKIFRMIGGNTRDLFYSIMNQLHYVVSTAFVSV